jgi:hypothetical protein
MVLTTVRGEAGSLKRKPRALKPQLTQGGPSGLSPLRSEGLVVVRREAGPRERQQMTLKGELENKSRKPWDLVRKWHSGSLKKST